MTHSARNHRPLRILVADDDPVNRRLYALLLCRAGHHPEIVGDGAQALEAMRQGAFDLVLLDMSMPGLDGPETARRIRQGQAGTACACLPILAITGFTGREERRCCLEAGMDGVLTKPLSLDDLEPWLRPAEPA